MGNQWWLRTQDETFGPETRARLIEWAQMGRIQPGQEISDDGETWRPATEIPFLDMRWSIDIGDGTPRGPFNKHAAQALLASGRLPKGSVLVEVVPPLEEEKTSEPEVAATPVETSAPAREEPARVAEESTPEEKTVDAEIVAELAALREEVKTLRAGMQSAEARAAEAEQKMRTAWNEKKEAVKTADLAQAHLVEAQKASVSLETRLAEAQNISEQRGAELARLQAEFDQQQKDSRQKLAARDSALAEKDSALAERDSALAEKDSALAARDSALAEKDSALAEKDSALAEKDSALAEKNSALAEQKDQLQLLSDEIKRLPPTAQLAADAQAAIYAIMQDEAAELTAALEAENREAEALSAYRRARTERLLARRQEILRHIGTDADDMMRRALQEHPEDPRTVHLRQEMEAMRLLQERTASEAERKIRDLSEKLRKSMGETDQLRQQSVDSMVLYRQLQETRERLAARETELAEARKYAQEVEERHAAERQALLARVSALELGKPGATFQSREAQSVKLSPWMGLK